MGSEQPPERGDLGLGSTRWESKENHASVDFAVAKHQLAEIQVVRDNDASLGFGEGQHITVGQRLRVVMCYRRNVVALVLEEGRDSVFCALIEQELRRPDAAAGRPLPPSVLVASSTRARANAR